MTRNVLTRSAMATVLAAALVPGTASAASFYIIESSPARLGNAFAGTASSADDASTVFFNGAGMTRLDSPTVTVAGHYIRPEAEFDNDGSTAATGTSLEAPLSGPDDTTDEPALVPNFYYATPLNDTVSFGLGVNAPFGLSSSYDDDWVGRYHATDSELKTININPSVAFAVNDQWSVGFGVNFQSIDATLENEVDSFAACVAGARAAGDPTPGATCAGAGLSPGQRSQDSSVEITGDDRNFGFDFSVLYELTADTRFGLSWRQGIEHTLEGDVEFDESSSCAGNAFCNGVTTDGDVLADVELPDIVTLSATHTIGENWRVDADVAWYRWSSIQELRIERPNGQEVSTLELDYEDTTRVALGATYSGLGAWTLRTGLAHDEAPISGPDTVTPRVPDGDRTWVTVGANLAFSDSASMDFGYAHLFVDEVEIENTEQGNTLKGAFDPTVDILAVSGNWRF